MNNIEKEYPLEESIFSFVQNRRYCFAKRMDKLFIEQGADVTLSAAALGVFTYMYYVFHKFSYDDVLMFFREDGAGVLKNALHELLEKNIIKKNVK